MPRLKPRALEEVAWDLERTMKLGSKIMSRLRVQEGPCAKEIRCMIGGCFELLVAELLSSRAGLMEIIYGETIQPPCIFWNGSLADGVAKSAPKGVADIEIYPCASEAWVVDVTLSSSAETQVFELRRLMSHSASLKTPSMRRVFVAPRIAVKSRNIEFIEVQPLIKNLRPTEPEEISYWVNVEEKIRVISKT